MTTININAHDVTSDRDLSIEVRAHTLAVAWLNCYLASSQDEYRAVLYRTLCLEIFDTGLQVIGCDGTAVFRAWVPAIGTDEAAWPLIGEDPERSIVVMDPDGFGIGFMRALLRVTKEEGHEYEPITICTAVADADATIALGDEFMTERVILRACGQRTDLRLYDGPYPKWRSAQLGIDAAELVDGMTIAPRILAMVGKLRGVTSVDLAFSGEETRIAFVARGDTEVRGILAPMRRMQTAAKAEA